MRILSRKDPGFLVPATVWLMSDGDEHIRRAVGTFALDLLEMGSSGASIRLILDVVAVNPPYSASSVWERRAVYTD